MRFFRLSVSLLLLLGASTAAQVPEDEWALEEAYRSQLLYVHALLNYAYDLRWQFDWERRQLAGSALRVNTGSVSSDRLLTDVELNINEQLNDKWRFQGRYTRAGQRQRAGRDEQLLLGFERSIFDASAVYVTVNPEFSKAFIDVAAGYTFYRDNREQYARVGVLFEDVNYDSKNDLGGHSEQEPVGLQWAVRLGLGGGWMLFSEGELGTGFERVFADDAKSPDVSRHDRREHTAQLRVSRLGEDETAWSAWVEWYEFSELMHFRQAGFDYDYRTTQLDLAAEHTRVVRDRHRWRFLVHYVDQKAQSRGFREHDYDRTDILGAAFYEFLWPRSSATLGYAFGQPDIAYRGLDPSRDYALGDYRDKIIAGWSHEFSDDARVRVSISHEVSTRGFGGGAVQFQMFF